MSVEGRGEGSRFEQGKSLGDSTALTLGKGKQGEDRIEDTWDKLSANPADGCIQQGPDPGNPSTCSDIGWGSPKMSVALGQS